ncbi:Nif11-like leader peptide family natural product precursor [Microcoleus sp. FACHB-672]|uniref:Nif11-like leader peptide family natural product precursor n=1 Tax=Microcoleus sp. FACHB-672 TaxID=2692825 RepID=UPI001689CB41|nr:Nif11-like leader peptide family natural product precursor [Microcoleus sp. FACHB-672]MBD2041251.1 Nif11-like leader peptide family natural product precursor [Microcoleus sp. FACHB-672]
MSKQSATQFLSVAARNTEVQENFKSVNNPQEFVKAAEELGYSFTTDELKDVVKEHSEGVTLRRKTGIWNWLRHINWIE